MLAEFIVMFRESLEVAFVTGIILAYLHKTKNEDQEKHVLLGVATGVVLSLLLAYLFQFVRGGFDANEALFEGSFMIFTAILVSWLMAWMIKQSKNISSLENDVRIKLEKNASFSLFFLALTTTLREGTEAVLFLSGISLTTGAFSLLGALLGLVAAIIIGFLVFEYAIKFNIGLFFKITAIMLVLLAAGLFSQGIHELQEAKILPTWVEHVYDINPPINPDGTYPMLHEKGFIGSILKGLIGYDGAPSDLQVFGYVGYLCAAYLFYTMLNKNPS